MKTIHKFRLNTGKEPTTLVLSEGYRVVRCEDRTPETTLRRGDQPPPSPLRVLEGVKDPLLEPSLNPPCGTLITIVNCLFYVLEREPIILEKLSAGRLAPRSAWFCLQGGALRRHHSTRSDMVPDPF